MPAYGGAGPVDLRMAPRQCTPVQHLLNGVTMRQIDCNCFGRFPFRALRFATCLHSLPLRFRSGLKATFGRNDRIVIELMKCGTKAHIFFLIVIICLEVLELRRARYLGGGIYGCGVSYLAIAGVFLYGCRDNGNGHN